MELGWGERIAVGGVTIEAVQVNHWGKRLAVGALAWLQRLPAEPRRRPGAVRERHAPTRAACRRLRPRARRRRSPILGTGAYDPWIVNHADPEQVWRMFEESGRRYLSRCTGTRSGSARSRSGDAMRRLSRRPAAHADRVVIRGIGDTWTMPMP